LSGLSTASRPLVIFLPIHALPPSIPVRAGDFPVLSPSAPAEQGGSPPHMVLAPPFLNVRKEELFYIFIKNTNKRNLSSIFAARGYHPLGHILQPCLFLTRSPLTPMSHFCYCDHSPASSPFRVRISAPPPPPSSPTTYVCCHPLNWEELFDLHSPSPLTDRDFAFFPSSFTRRLYYQSIVSLFLQDCFFHVRFGSPSTSAPTPTPVFFKPPRGVWPSLGCITCFFFSCFFFLSLTLRVGRYNT